MVEGWHALPMLEEQLLVLEGVVEVGLLME